MAKKAVEGEVSKGEQCYNMVQKDGLTFGEVAEKLGNTYGTVKMAAMSYALRNGLKLDVPIRTREGRGNEAKFQFACRKDEQEAIAAAAEEKGVSQSEFIRNAALKAAKFQPAA
jgi:predicted transcriptional regulator